MNFDDFLQKEIIRNGPTAVIIFDYLDNDPNKPVRLRGFEDLAEKTDYEILENGFLYFKKLMEVGLNL